MIDERILLETLKQARSFAHPKDLSPLIDKLADTRIVMLGESSHGTSDFYEWRRIITEWLIVKHGFSFVAVEGDWPAVMGLHRYVTRNEGTSARSVLASMHRWPTWMWANTDVLRFAEWMRSHNERVPIDSSKVGFFGLDVYSLFESIDWVIDYLNRTDPFLSMKVQRLYSCFLKFNRNEIAYMRSLTTIPQGCQQEAVDALQALLNNRIHSQANDPNGELLFDARQNARIVRNAETYYRSTIQASEQGWNIRDQHMMDTLDLLLERYGPSSRCIVWAHNSHIGDYRATDMLSDGLVNLGGLARIRHGDENVSLVGFSTYEGQVIASPAWDGPIEKMPTPPARTGSYEEVFHTVSEAYPERRFFLLFDRATSSSSPLSSVLDHRAIGVVYDPKRERWGNYVPTSMARRYDALIHIDTTRALEPLLLPYDRTEIPETWPAGQ